VHAAAKALVELDLINHGWTYVVVDLGWQSGKRNGEYNAILPNEKFPDMQGLHNYIHSVGLKSGIYSSPWVSAYRGYLRSYAGESSDYAAGTFVKPKNQEEMKRVGKYTFERNDVQQWEEWGIDYLKYDWSPLDLPSVKRMAHALRTANRDIIYSLANNAPIANAAEYMNSANCVRTTIDLIDVWNRDWEKYNIVVMGKKILRGGPYGISEIWNKHPQWQPFSGPGHWADPDMLVLGWLGADWSDGKLHKSRLTDNEQYTHFSLWCLWSAPLFLGCDLTKIDNFTLNLITNDEVIAINQDPLGIQAKLVKKDGTKEIWAKKLEDGSKAVGLFNRSAKSEQITINWFDLDIYGEHIVRDLWRQKDLGIYENTFTVDVPTHGVALVKIASVH
jgi:alpha-galactosidase